MIITCPNNPEHKRFRVNVAVSEPWKVDEHGDFVEVIKDRDTETIRKPSYHDDYECLDCDAYAEVTDDQGRVYS